MICLSSLLCVDIYMESSFELLCIKLLWTFACSYFLWTYTRYYWIYTWGWNFWLIGIFVVYCCVRDCLKTAVNMYYLTQFCGSGIEEQRGWLELPECPHNLGAVFLTTSHPWEPRKAHCLYDLLCRSHSHLLMPAVSPIHCGKRLHRTWEPAVGIR